MSNSDETPIVEVSDAFEEDDFVGAPPPSSVQADEPRPNNRPNTRARLPAILRHQRPASPIFTNLDSSSPVSSKHTEPVTYTPRHPSESRQNTHPEPARRATRRTRNEALLSNSVEQPPAQRAATTQPQPPRMPPLRPSFIPSNLPSTQSSILRPPIINQPINPTNPSNIGDMLGNSGPNSWSSQLFNTRLGSAPSFTTFGNGTPQSQTSIDWRTHYLNRPNLPSTNNRLPIPAHVQAPVVSNSHLASVPSAHSSRKVAPQTANLIQAHSSGGSSRQCLNNVFNVPQQPPQLNNANFTPQAIPVRTAYDDFLRQVQTTVPGVDNILNQLINYPNQPVQISVPNGVDNAALQQRVHQQLESALLMQSSNPSVPFASMNDPGTQKLIDDLINIFDATKPMQPQPMPKSVPAPKPQPPPPPPLPPSEDDMAKQDIDADAHDEEYREVETYADYVPAKLTIGKQHPDPVVETSSLSTVEPPDIEYRLKLPADVIDKARLSALQLESVIYSCQQHNKFLADNRTRRGFLIGDGAGVGKGRTIAGIIYENYLCGRKKSIWLSVSTDLKLDAERDLKDIGAKIPVHLLGKFQYGRKIDASHGVMFLTYAGLVSKSQSVRGSLGNRLDQLINWVGNQFDGVIVFDECHKAKNISMTKNKKNQTKAAEFALLIQERLPRARVVYASATGASETKHLGYMTRLGIWGRGTPYETFVDFCNAIERRGVGAMELVAVDLKMRGSYIARQLSFKTTSFEIKIAHLDDDFIKLYDDCVEMWAKALMSFTEAADYVSDKKSVRTIWTSFWGAHQKFFKYLCIGAKVPLVIQIAKEALANDKCVVIGLQSTGEAKALEALEDGDINEFISTARATFESLVTNHFPGPYEGRRLRQTANRSPTDSSLASAPPTPTSGSSSSTIDESYPVRDSVKFVVEDGVVLEAQVETDKVKKHERKPVTRQRPKNEKVLAELAEQKRNHNNVKSSRAQRAQRRRLLRKPKTKSRIKVPDDSDTEISNPLSSSSSGGVLPSTSSRDDSDSTFSEGELSSESSSETMVGSDDSDASVYINPKRRKAPVSSGQNSNKKVLASESDSDIEIVGTIDPKPKPRPKEKPTIITLSDDEDDEGEDSDGLITKNGAKLKALRDELYEMLDDLEPRLPKNTLDDLIHQLGGPSNVAEMTGRKGRIVQDEDGQISYKSRNLEDALENLNIAEKERFMKGQKFVAIISEAASSGISLQSDKRCQNTKRRVHITIELPWSADRAIQQFGRTHRSNQVNGPEYVFIISELAGEKRFASIVAKRLESLGALTHGDRRATTESRDLSQYNILSKYSKHALGHLFTYLESGGATVAGIRADYYDEREFIRRAREAFVGVGLAKQMMSIFSVEQNASQINHFLNRLLGMKVGVQNALFQLFTDYLNRVIARKKVSGHYDSGILELNSESGKTRCSPPVNFFLKTDAEDVKCTLREVQVERGVAWEEALVLLEESQRARADTRSSFYIHTNPLTKARSVYLALREPEMIDMFRNYKPNTGRQAKAEHYSISTEKGRKCSPEEAEALWRHVYRITDTHCVHICFFDCCKRREAKMKCDIGLRHRKYCILSGGILTAWPYLEKKAADVTTRLQIVRLKLDSNNRVIGPIIPQDSVERVKQLLKKGEEEGVKF